MYILGYLYLLAVFVNKDGKAMETFNVSVDSH